jgi:hypothetical protein
LRFAIEFSKHELLNIATRKFAGAKTSGARGVDPTPAGEVKTPSVWTSVRFAF